MLESYLLGARERLGVANLSFCVPGISGLELGAANSVFTYASEWAERYVSKEYDRIDPVARFDPFRTSPISWTAFPQGCPTISWLFREAESYGVGRQGVSIPVRGGLGTAGVLSLTTFQSAREWERGEWMCRGIGSVLGPYIHDVVFRLQRSSILVEGQPILTARQKRCFECLANGNTAKQIAAELGISGAMVRSHLHAARRRLGARSISSALVKAASLGLLTPE
ncbi:helix-turn-helix transcriptional regulator [Terrihabitans sp. B22-R8]|uniref:helix-turn-helix transcriptional regulator n=1 Tax=Terrihabitans sp. B22-R8 TaxID=3425128 RepID=UPI00403CAB75